jgi:uncharacterized membrane protein YciS (DUF1049 family)
MGGIPKRTMGYQRSLEARKQFKQSLLLAIIFVLASSCTHSVCLQYYISIHLTKLWSANIR